MNLFGKKKAAPAPKLSDSIALLRDAQTTLEKREKHLEKQVVAARDAAKEKLKAKDKRGAIHLLKRSKLLETQINQIYGKKANIDIQIMALESAASNKEIFDVMRAGKDALKVATASTDVDKVADVMEDIAESIQMNDEVNEQMAQPIGPQVDEDELNAELEEMENELMDQQLLAAPDVPVTATKAKEPVVAAASQPAVAAASAAAAAAPQRQVVMAGGDAAPAAAAPAASANKKLSAKEQSELKELEALMGM